MSFGEFYNATAGLGDAYSKGLSEYDQKLALSKLGTQLQGGDYSGAAGTAFNTGDLNTGLSLMKLGQAQAQQKANAPLLDALTRSYSGAPVDATPAFAGGSAKMSIPSSNNEIENKFIGALKEGGLTNPVGLAAAAAYGRRESGYSPDKIGGSWSDPSQSGQAGTSGGILSWRNERLGSMRAATAGSSDPVTAQAKFFLTEDPNVTMALQNAKSPEEANDILAKAWKFAGYNSPGTGEHAARLNTTRAYLARLGGQQDPTQIASAPAAMPPGASGLNPDALSARPTPLPPARPSDAQLAMVGQPTQVASADPNFVPGAPSAQVAPAAAPTASTDGEGDAPDAPVPPQARAQVSAAAPANLEQAGLPRQAAAAVGATAPASQARIGLLMRLSLTPGLDQGQSALVGKLLSNELEQTKLPDSAKQYLFAKSAAGGGFDGTYADFQNKKGDEGAKIQAQLAAREKYLTDRGMDPKDPGNQAWIMGGKTSTGHVLKPGDILSGPGGQELARNASAASSMPEETADFLAERVISGDNRALVGLGRGAQGAENLAKIQGLVARKAAERGLDGTDILYNASKAAGIGAQERSLGTSAGRMAAASVEAEGAIRLGLEASAKVPRGTFVPLNRAIQMVQSNTGSPELKQFVAANNTIVNTFARAISPSGTPTVADKEHAREMLSTADGPEAYAAVLQQMQREIDMAHKAPQQASSGLERERQAAKPGVTLRPNPFTPAPTSAPAQAAPPAAPTPPAPAARVPTATNPKTGEKIELRNGQWVPVQAPAASDRGVL
jgi:hypothetical protein